MKNLIRCLALVIILLQSILEAILENPFELKIMADGFRIGIFWVALIVVLIASL